MKKLLIGLLFATPVHATLDTTSIATKDTMKLASFYANKKVLVTGGAGFIGSHIAQKLVELGAHVTILDNFCTGSHENIAHIKDQITLIEDSVTNPQACYRATQDQEIVFHLAAFISVPQSVERPADCHASNVDGTFNLLHASAQNGVKRFVFSSSCSVYGEREEVCSEDIRENPTSPYATSKLIGEFLCKQFTINSNLACVLLRYFNVYGPRQNPQAAYAAAVAKFTYQMERNLPITIFGDGTQTRDFVHVNDVVHANLMTGMLDEQLVCGKIFNVGSGESISILTLIERLKKQFPSYTGATLFAPARPGDVKHVTSSCTRLKKLLEIQ